MKTLIYLLFPLCPILFVSLQVELLMGVLSDAGEATPAVVRRRLALVGAPGRVLGTGRLWPRSVQQV